MKTLIDFIYTLLIGAAVAVFVGLGIWAFYSGPKTPEFPAPSYYSSEELSVEEKEKDRQNQQKYDREYKEYTKASEPYSKKVSGIALGAAVIFYGGGLWFYKRKDVIGEGLALGAVFTASYAAARGGMGESKILVFVCVSALLLMLIGLVLYRSGSRLIPKNLLPRKK